MSTRKSFVASGLIRCTWVPTALVGLTVAVLAVVGTGGGGGGSSLHAGTAMDARTVKIPMTRVVVTFMAILRFERKGARGTHGTASAVADGGRMWHGRPTAA